MAADLREMQENQWVSEIRIDKSRFVEIIISDNARYGKKKRDPDRIIIRVPLWICKESKTVSKQQRFYISRCLLFPFILLFFVLHVNPGFARDVS